MKVQILQLKLLFFIAVCILILVKAGTDAPREPLENWLEELSNEINKIDGHSNG